MNRLDSEGREQLADAYTLIGEARILTMRLAGVADQPGLIALTESMCEKIVAAESILSVIAHSMHAATELRRDIEATPKQLLSLASSEEFRDAIRSTLKEEIDEIIAAGRESAVEVVSSDLNERMRDAMVASEKDVFGESFVASRHVHAQNSQLTEANEVLKGEIERLNSELSKAAKDYAENLEGKFVERAWGFRVGLLVGALLAALGAAPAILAALHSIAA